MCLGTHLLRLSSVGGKCPVTFGIANEYRLRVWKRCEYRRKRYDAWPRQMISREGGPEAG